MSCTRFLIFIAALSLLIAPASTCVFAARAEEAPRAKVAATASVPLDDDSASELDPPPGDPWYSAAPQQRPPRPSPADRLVFKARITPHWYDNNRRFWYRNELAGGSVGVRVGRRPRRATRGRPSITTSWRRHLRRPPAKPYQADRLPFDGDRIRRRLESCPFKVGDVDWKCDLGSYECSKSNQGLAAPAAAPSRRRGRARQRRRQQGRRAADATAPARATARFRPTANGPRFVKDHNVFVRAKELEGEIAAEQRRQGGAGLRPAFVVARLEDARRLPHRAGRSQGSLPDPVVAPGRRPGQAANPSLPAARRQVRGLRAQPVRRRRPRSRSRPKVDRIDFGHAATALEQGRPPLHL